MSGWRDRSLLILTAIATVAALAGLSFGLFLAGLDPMSSVKVSFGLVILFSHLSDTEGTPPLIILTRPRSSL